MNRPQPVVLAVVVSTFFVGFGGGVVFPILPNLGVILSISPFMVGVILSANRFTRIFANAPAGSMVDRIGTRTPFIVGLFVEGFATLGYVVAMNTELPEVWFLVARVLWGIGSALVFATAYTIAADVSTGSSRGTSIGIVRGGITLGFPAGLVLGGVVSDAYSISTAFIVAAIFALVASVIAYRLVPETHVDTHRTTVKPWEIDTSIPAITVGFVNFAIFFAYLGALFATLVLFAAEFEISIWGYGPQGTSGILMAVTVVFAAVFTLAGGKLSDLTQTRTPILTGFLIVLFIGFLLLALADSLVTVLFACVMIGTGQGGTSGPLIALLADLTPNERMGRAMGTNNILGDIGGALGPLLTLPLISTIGFTPIYAACAVIPLIAILFLIVGVYIRTGEINPSVEYTSTD